MAKQLTFPEVIEKLGGVDATAELFGVGDTAVYNWLSWGRFPQQRLLEVDRICRQRGINYDPSPKRSAA